MAAPETFADSSSGLSAAEAGVLQLRYGLNELPSAQPKSVWRIVLDVIREPMLILLVSCGTLYLFLGDTGEGIMLMASVIIVLFITFFQEKKTERALEELRDLSSPRVLVIRDGTEQRIPGRDVVPGDLIILQEGDRVPADAVLLSGINLQADESLLTGESLAVTKSPAEHSAVFSGTLIVRGHGTARVTTTGLNTEIGKIGRLLKEVADEPSLLQKETGRIVRTFSILGLGLCILLTIIYGFTQSDWLNGILYGLSLAMAMLPEEFAVVLTIFMALGAWRLSKKHVLTRKPSAIEALGSVTVLCTDKTGTLTENRMKVRRLFCNEEMCSPDAPGAGVSAAHRHLLQLGVRAGQSKPFDPMELAIARAAADYPADGNADAMELLHEYPLSPQLMAMSRMYTAHRSAANFVAAKGAPEAIAELCRLTDAQKEQLRKHVAEMAAGGLRVLGVASAAWSGTEFPEDQRAFVFTFAGLIGMEDPLRASIGEDLRSCYNAGIRVIMVTGDYPGTAQHIARSMGLQNPDEIITGAELKDMDELQLRQRIRSVNIFARMVPEQKLMLVEALKANGEIVGMTGDGVNDAPALRAAHIGIAMGQRGTDVAREAADLVLLDDNFSSVISAVRMGRRIYDNIRKAMTYILAVHVPIAGLTLVPVFFPFLPVILFPLHIALMELIIDPASSLIFEAEEEEKNVMNRKPADIHVPAFGAKKIIYALSMGLSVLAICLGVYFISRYLQRPPDETRALTFTTLIVANIGLIFINRSYTRSIVELVRERNTSVKWVVGGAFVLLLLVLFVPPVRASFHFSMLHGDDLLICATAGILAIALFELIKMSRWRRNHPHV